MKKGQRNPKEIPLLAMDQFDEIHRERITALLQAIYATKSIRDDSVPCQIEEVIQVDMKLLFY